MEEFGTDHVVARSINFSSGKTDGKHAGNDIEENLKSLVNGYEENGSLSDDANSWLSADIGECGKKNLGHDENRGIGTCMGGTETDGLQEFPLLAEEFECNETLKRKEDEDKIIVEDKRIVEGTTNHNSESYRERQRQSEVPAEGQGQSELAHAGNNSTSVEGNGMPFKHHSAQSKSQKIGASVLGKGGNSSSQIQKSKFPHQNAITLKGSSKVGAKDSLDTNSKQKKNASEKSQVEGAEVLSHASNSSLHRTVNHGGARSNHTVPQPFALATGKRASIGVRPADDVAVGSAARHISASGMSSSVTKNTRLALKSALTPSTTKTSRSGNLKLPDHILKPLQQMELNHDEDDACSVASSTRTSVRASTMRLSSFTSASGFGSRCDERAEKRKEFFSKLDEKLQAKEVERSQLQAKTKEEKDAAIKQLRKSLTFKATPMPNFYHEAAPPKVELKKIPPTRAKSPKLGRRNTCVGVESEGNPSQLCRTARLSLDQGKINKGVQKLTHDGNAGKASDKDSMVVKKTMRKSLTKLPSEKSIKTKANESLVSSERQVSNISETGSVNGSTESGKFTTVSTSHNSSTSLNYEERLEVHDSESIEEQNEANHFNEKSETAEVNFEDNILRESDSLIDTVEDAGSGSLALVQDLQVLDGFKSKINGSKVLPDLMVQKTVCTQTDANGTEDTYGSSSLQSSSQEIQ